MTPETAYVLKNLMIGTVNVNGQNVPHNNALYSAFMTLGCCRYKRQDHIDIKFARLLIECGEAILEIEKSGLPDDFND